MCAHSSDVFPLPILQASASAKYDIAWRGVASEQYIFKGAFSLVVNSVDTQHSWTLR